MLPSLSWFMVPSPFGVLWRGPSAAQRAERQQRPTLFDRESNATSPARSKSTLAAQRLAILMLAGLEPLETRDHLAVTERAS
jgi:hypothetical protein